MAEAGVLRHPQRSGARLEPGSGLCGEPGLAARGARLIGLLALALAFVAVALPASAKGLAPRRLVVQPGVAEARDVVTVTGRLHSVHRRVRLRIRGLGIGGNTVFHRTGRRTARGRIPHRLTAAIGARSGGGTALPISISGHGMGRGTLLLRVDPPFGIAEDVQYLTGRALNDRLDAYKRLGVSWVRFQMIWSSIQAAGPGKYDWKPYDDLMRGLARRGLHPLVALDTTPLWARPASCKKAPTCAPAHPSDYAAFAQQAVRRYAPLGARWWEIWNEPNTARFWGPAPSASAYARLLIASYGPMKAANPSITVISGGLAPAETETLQGTVTRIAPVDFLRDVYAAGAHGSFDAIGFHPYTFPALPSSHFSGSAWFQLYGTPTSVRSLMLAGGDGGKAIWGTEFGAPTAGQDSVPEAAQATMASAGYRIWSAYPWTGPLFWYSYLDRGTNASDREDFFGLVRHDGAPKPAYWTFRALAAGP
jgi:polysaccharide biosynthesis protein PslG